MSASPEGAGAARLQVEPGPALAGSFTPPGDKSITHRAYLLALLAAGESVIDAPNPGEDCERTLAIARALGASVARTSHGVTVRGPETLTEPDDVLECGNSGTTLRLCAGVLAGESFLSVLTGDASLRRRPVARVIEPLRRMGAQAWARAGDRLPPLAIRGGPLRPIEYSLEVASAQVASCVLLAGLRATGRTSVLLPGAARDHTERMLAAGGLEVETAARPGTGPRLSIVGPARPGALHLRVPGDFSAAAFFLAGAAATPGACVMARDVGLNPTRTGFLDVLAAMGAEVAIAAERVEGGEPCGNVTVTGPESLRAFDVPAAWIPRLIDEVPAWAIVAAAARGTSRITGAAELRVKESDRLAALARNLGRLGVVARERPDGIEIEGGKIGGGRVDAEADHRIAMTFAILATRGENRTIVSDATSIDTSFPGFLDTLCALGGRAALAPPEAHA